MMKIIKSPLVTEKNTLHSAAGVYVFEVELSADKEQIRKAVELGFGVKVDSVRTVNCRGQAKRTKYGIGKVPYWKKAFVKLKEGERIPLFEGA